MRPYDNSAATEYIIPTATQLIRPGFVSATCAAGSSNLFTQGGVASDGSLKLNRRYTMIDQLTILQDSATDQTITVSVNLRPDSRDQITGDAYFTGSSTASNDSDKLLTQKITITGKVNYDTGEVMLSGIFKLDPASSYTYSFVSARVKARFVPVSTMNTNRRNK